MLRSTSNTVVLPDLDAPVCCHAVDGAPVSGSGLAFEVALATAGDGDFIPPEWIQLTPRGPQVTRDGRSFDFNPEKLVAAFTKDGLKLPVDFEHETNFISTLGARPARSWIVELEARAAGLFGKVEWLPDAIAALKSKAYRYISPTFYLEADRKSARHVVAAALCTSPALSMPQLASSVLPVPNGDRPMKDLLAKLGLTENATEAEAMAKLSAMTPDPTQYVPVAQLTAANEQLATLQVQVDAGKAEAETQKCNTLIDKGVADGKITPAAKDHYFAFARADFAGCSAAIDAMPKLVSAGLNKEIDEAQKTSEGPASLSAEEASVATSLGLSVEAYQAAKAA